MICSHCKQEMPDESKFCTHCGTPNATTLFLPASWGKRLGNYLIDQVLKSVLSAAVFFSMDFVPNREAEISVFVLGVLLYFLYQPLLEYFFGQTLGKMATGTKVVRMDGNKVHFWQTMGRTLARYIPLEPLSFIFRKFPTGWHDLLSGTYVVDKKMTPEEVRMIDPKVVNAQKSSTAIIIVIVIVFMIAIIGILSSVVLASLGTARAKGKISALQADMSQLRVKAETYAVGNNESYVDFCKLPEVGALQKHIPEGLTYTCNDSEKAWAISVPVPSLKAFGCVDSSINPSKLIEKTLGEATACPGMDWRVMEAKNKAFTVETPGEMEVKTDERLDGGSENKDITFQQDYYKIYADDGFYAIIQHTYSRPFTTEERNNFAENYLADFAKLTKSEILDYKPGVEDGKIVGEFVLPVPASGELIKGKIYVGKDSSYLLLVGAEKMEFPADSYFKFVDSLKITRE